MNHTIYDYVDWRGDLSANQFPYNEVDFLIFSQFAYVYLDDIPIHGQSLSELYQSYEDYINSLSPNEKIHIHNESHFLFKKMAYSLRYQNIRIIGYQSELDKELIKQFSVASLLLEDGRVVIVYRGTDDTLIGWHEDFLMLCEKEVPAQNSAVLYLNKAYKTLPHISFIDDLKNKFLDKNIFQRIIKHYKYKKKRPIILAGHSKGGNLAMYAGCFTQSAIKECIEHIYSYDGPGFQEEVVRSSNYQNMLSKIESYIPHYSFFGIVLGHEEKYHVVHSHYTGMLQHNAFSWDVGPYHFIQDELSYESVQFALKVVLFLEKLTYEDKHELVKAMFGLFDSLDIYTFTDLSHLSYKHLINAIKELTLLESSVRKRLMEIFAMLWSESMKTKKD